MPNVRWPKSSGSVRLGAHIYLLGNPVWQGRLPIPEQRSCEGWDGGAAYATDATDRLVASDHESGKILGEVPSLRHVTSLEGATIRLTLEADPQMVLARFRMLFEACHVSLSPSNRLVD